MTAGSHGTAATVRRRLVVRGHVQGVFFRASTRRTAEQAGVTGWVQNASDGAVVAEVQGTADAVAAVEAFVRQGPEQAHVQRVETTDLDPVADETGFEIAG